MEGKSTEASPNSSLHLPHTHTHTHTHILRPAAAHQRHNTGFIRTADQNIVSPSILLITLTTLESEKKQHPSSSNVLMCLTKLGGKFYLF